MNGFTKVVKGRIEEATGVLTNNDKLRIRGQTDQAVGHVRQVGEKSVRQVKKSAQRIVDKARNVANEAVNKAKSQRIS